MTQAAEPRRLQAAPADIKLAQEAEPVTGNPLSASPTEIDRLRNLIIPLADRGANDARSAISEAGLAFDEHRVMQWQPDWVQYDGYFRPLFLNPFPEPLKLIYEVEGVPRILRVPPRGRVVTEVPEPGSYNFTALRLNVLGLPIDVAVGNFFGGGYFPGPGLPPPPPPPMRTLTDALVQVKYTNATFRPIVVRELVDVGSDPLVGGERKVLLDGVTPAWGEWKQNAAGVPQFEIHTTQRFPGIEVPAEGPLPGNYDLRLLSDSSPTGPIGKGITFTEAAASSAALGIGAIVLTIFLRKRRRPQH